MKNWLLSNSALHVFQKVTRIPGPPGLTLPSQTFAAISNPDPAGQAPFQVQQGAEPQKVDFPLFLNHPHLHPLVHAVGFFGNGLKMKFCADGCVGVQAVV